MTCPRDMIFSVLYGGDRDLTQFYVHQSMDRLGAEWEKREFEPDLARVLFFLLLEKDMELKQAVIDGLPQICVEPLNARKAESFFLALRQEVIDPWLSDERHGLDKFIDMVTNLYLVS